MNKEYKEAEEGIRKANLDYCVCNDLSYFDDDVQTECHKCGKPIVHRPYIPKELSKVCIECMNKMK